jgi:hypothetical protein
MIMEGEGFWRRDLSGYLPSLSGLGQYVRSATESLTELINSHRPRLHLSSLA